MRTFVRVVERGSLSAVAREFGTGQSSVTRHLRGLEEALGASLLSRTTRRSSLTDEGAAFYRDCLDVLRQVDLAGERVAEMRSATQGTVRISCSAAIGILHVSKLVFAFQDAHPGILVDLGLTDRPVDLVREAVDVALRLGPVADSSLRMRALGSSRRILVASPGYLAARGVPTKPSDLCNHEIVTMSNVAGSDTLQIRSRTGETQAVPVSGRLRVDHGLAAREALIAGRGIAAAHRWLVDDLVTQGVVEPVLSAYSLPPVPLNLLIVPERAGVARVRRLVDYLAKTITDVPGLTA